MVDLMMWLVIAAMLLATALQSIGYYQKNANVYLMKAEVDVVASRVMAASADQGRIDPALIDSIVAEENAARPNDSIIISWGEGGASAATASPAADFGFERASVVTAATPVKSYFLKATTTAVQDADVVYFLDDSANYSTGVHLIEKDALGAGTGAPTGVAVNNNCYVGQWKVTYIDAFNFTKSTPYSVNCESESTAIKQYFNYNGSQYLPSRVDNFSMRWEKDLVVPATTNYTFTGKGDDYVKVYLDGVQVLSVTYLEGNKTATVSIPAGTHKLKVEMTEGVSTGNIDFKYAPTP
jgi:hypothetical protein